MYKKYWKELLVLGLIHYSIVGLMLMLFISPLMKWYMKIHTKIITDSKGFQSEEMPLSINGKLCYDENGKQMMATKGIPAVYASQFLMFTLLLLIASVITITILLPVWLS